MNDILRLSDQYCTILKRCLQFYHESSLDKSVSYAHTRRGLIFLKDFPLDAVRLTGVKLWKYREVVNGGNLGIIEHVAKDQHVQDTPDSQKDIAGSVVFNVTQTWRSLKDDYKDEFTKQISDLLIIYAQILQIEKNNKAEAQYSGAGQSK